jgi:outer membrane immunogenic protein
VKKIFAAAAAGAAWAALSAISPATAAPPEPVWNWSGFYIGANVGYSAGSSNGSLSLFNATTGAVLDSASNKFNLDGLIGGGQIGYNWQVDRVVFGVEADMQGSGQRGGTSLICPGGTGLPPLPAGLNGVCSLGSIEGGFVAAPLPDSLTEKLDWFGTLRGRLGATITPATMIYATGGLAFGRVSATDTVSGTNFSLNGTPTNITSMFSTGSTKTGWTLGGGLEMQLWGHWSGKIEYLYINLGNISGSFVTPIVASPGNFLGASFNSAITDNIVRVGINYRFY